MPRKIGATSSIAITAVKARKIAKDNVPSPYNHGIDRVDRVIDTIETFGRVYQSLERLCEGTGDPEFNSGS